MKTMFNTIRNYWWNKAWMLVLIPLNMTAQEFEPSKSLNKELNRIVQLIECHNYPEAVKEGLKLYHQHPFHPDVCLTLGLGYINQGNHPDSAIYYLKKGMESLGIRDSSGETRINLILSLAKAHQLNLQPLQAIEIYSGLLKDSMLLSSTLMHEITHEIEVCRNAEVLLDHPVFLKITNLGDGVNSEYDDHSPLVSLMENEIYFTSRRKQTDLSLLDDGQYPEKVFYSTTCGHAFGQSHQLKNFFKRNEHESAVSISPDGKTMYLFKNDEDGKNLYSSQLCNQVWSDPQKLPEPINSTASETHCSVTADGSTLYFTSNRSGGLGGLDIYRVNKLPDGSWGEALNLGPRINTEFDEETPMIYLDGKTLYFASEGHNSMGMYDIFYSCLANDNSWNEPINLGYPINTPGDDFFFVPSIYRNKACYATSRFADNKGGMDLYMVEFDSQFKGELAIVEGKVDQGGVSKTIRLLVSRVEDEMLVGDYRPDLVTGAYTMFLETGYRYQVKAVKQESEEMEWGEIEIPVAYAFSNENKILHMKDIPMAPPLTPVEMRMVKRADDAFPVQEDEPELQETFTIQLLALKKEPISDYAYFEGLDRSKIKVFKCKDGYYRYVYDVYGSKTESVQGRVHVLQSGRFKDSFVRPVQSVIQLAVDNSIQHTKEESTPFAKRVIGE